MISIRCLVDNTAQRSSAMWAEHGVSFAIETPDGIVLFDTGQSGDVLLHNAACMGVPLDQIDALAFSHAHYDHTGGIDRFLQSAAPGLPVYANPDLFQDRFERTNGAMRSIGLRSSAADLEQRVSLRLQAAPTAILPGVWTTGVIADRTEFEGRGSNHFFQEDGYWLPDPYRDDLSLVVETRGGLVVVCGCCHAGLLNTLAHVRRNFRQPVAAVVGGTHLASAADEPLRHAVAVIDRDYREPAVRFFPNHCTGERAYFALYAAFGDRVQPCPAGTVLQFL